MHFDLADIRQRLRHAVEYPATDVHVGQLASAEHHRDLNLVALPQELPGVPDLEIKIVIVDARPEFDFLEVNYVLLLLGSPGGLGLLELELPVVHDLDHRRTSRGGDFYQIETPFVRRSERFLDGKDSELLTRFSDDPDRTDPDLSVDTGPLFALYGQW